MKKLFSLLLTFSFLGMGVHAQTADEIITKNIQAMGGVDKLKSIQSVVMEGKINAQGMEIPISMSMVKNTAMRTDFSVMGMNAWMIMRKDSGWTFMPFRVKQNPKPFLQICLKRLRTSWILKENWWTTRKKEVPLNISEWMTWKGPTAIN
ncbi:MAG: hypothetical protein U0T81_16830 [Saprospiraceae bacterium]